MRHSLCLFLPLFALLLTSPAQSQNLIQNADAEDALVSGEIPSWTEEEGNDWQYRQNNPSPQSGSNYFFAGVGSNAELRQDVDVSGYATDIDAGSQQFTFFGYVSSYSQSSPDESQVILEYRDASGTVLDSYDSGRISNTGSWKQLSDLRTAPADTRTIRVRLISIRNAGSNNDGYFDNLSLEPGNTLPVELTSFRAEVDDGSVALHWSTTSETNNAGFAIQHKRGGGWTTLGFQNGHGTTSATKHYNYRATDLHPGRHVFRLEQVDHDGTAHLSDEVAVTLTVDGAYVVSAPAPNPFRAHTTLTVAVEQTQTVDVRLYDVLGRQVASLHTGTLASGVSHPFIVDRKTISSGTYVLHVSGETFDTSRQLVALE